MGSGLPRFPMRRSTVQPPVRCEFAFVSYANSCLHFGEHALRPKQHSPRPLRWQLDGAPRSRKRAIWASGPSTLRMGVAGRTKRQLDDVMARLWTRAPSTFAWVPCATSVHPVDLHLVRLRRREHFSKVTFAIGLQTRMRGSGYHPTPTPQKRFMVCFLWLEFSSCLYNNTKYITMVLTLV